MAFFKGLWFVLKGLWRLLKCVITLGGSECIRESEEEREEAYKQYQVIYAEVSEHTNAINSLLAEVGREIELVNKTLKSVRKLILTHAELNSSYKSQTLLTYIDKFSKNHSYVLQAGFGGVVGGASAVGAWAIVSLVGSASTGTAIATLSGVAASNATLAWFGGGALAAGGAGMAGGAAVLGGIVALPMMYFATKSSYKRVEQIEKETQDIKIEEARLKVELPDLIVRHDAIYQRAQVIKSLTRQFRADIQYLEQQLPSGMLISFRVAIKGRNQQENAVISDIESCVSQFVNNFTEVCV
ncbi:hypothetical protein [Shewanella sp. GXUN23E]|uniref:hypothetical protein n=1 Tax=Shewanella sp. GXUN23E TaxID=3422498 RepID=UPI003D7DA2E6